MLEKTQHAGIATNKVFLSGDMSGDRRCDAPIGRYQHTGRSLPPQTPPISGTDRPITSSDRIKTVRPMSNSRFSDAKDTWRKIDYGFKRLKDAHTSLDDENVCLKNRCASLKKSVKRLKKSLVYLKDKINELTDKVTDLSMHVLTLSNREIQLGERIMQLEASNAQLEASNAQLLARNAQLENESNAREMNNENDL